MVHALRRHTECTYWRTFFRNAKACTILYSLLPKSKFSNQKKCTLYRGYVEVLCTDRSSWYNSENAIRKTRGAGTQFEKLGVRERKRVVVGHRWGVLFSYCIGIICLLHVYCRVHFIGVMYSNCMDIVSYCMDILYGYVFGRLKTGIDRAGGRSYLTSWSASSGILNMWVWNMVCVVRVYSYNLQWFTRSLQTLGVTMG